MGRNLIARVGFGLFLLYVQTGVSVEAASRENQRAQFQQAMSAIKKGEMATFFKIEPQLRNYVLHDHLRFALADRTVRTGELSIAQNKALSIEKEFRGRSLAWRIMRSYRQRLRDEQRWELLFESASLSSAPKMECATLKAQESLGILQADDPVLTALWAKARWREDCKWVVQRQLASAKVSVKNLWLHVYALMGSGRLEEAKAFKRYFSRRDQRHIEAWIAGYRDPLLGLQDTRWHENTELNTRVFAQLVARLSRTDIIAARVYWGKANKQKRYNQSTLNAIARRLSLRAASDYEPRALDWLKWLPASTQDTKTYEARARLALRLGDWGEVFSAVEAMPVELKEKNDWRYWRAVALLELGKATEARQALTDLASARSYYGFLAADRMNLSYAMRDSPTPRNAEIRSSLQARTDVQRMREYLFVGLPADARSEWKVLLKKLDIEQRAELSLLVLDWGWFDRAIATNGRTAHNDDLRVRFPFAFENVMQTMASENELSLPWVYAVARRESLFQPDVRSGAGAIGMMQLMPDTAKDIARRTRKKLYTGALENADFNIALGAFYLRYLLDRFDGHHVMATAAYNAGLSRIPRWLGEQSMAADRWIETVPYRETRGYLKAVMAYATVYDWRQDGRVDVRLSQRMPKLPARKS